MKSRLWLIACAGLLGTLTSCAGGDRLCREPGYTCEAKCDEDDADCVDTTYPHKRGGDASGDHAGSMDN